MITPLCGIGFGKLIITCARGFIKDLAGSFGGSPEGEKMKLERNGIIEKARSIIVAAGHALYRASVSVKEFGELAGIPPVARLGKEGRRFGMALSIK